MNGLRRNSPQVYAKVTLHNKTLKLFSVPTYLNNNESKSQPQLQDCAMCVKK